MSRDGRLSMGFLGRPGLPIAPVYAAHKSNGALRLKPFDPYDSEGTDAKKSVAMFHTGTTKKSVTTTEGTQEIRDEHWLYLTTLSRNMTEDERLRKSKAETEKLLTKVGLKSKEARNVIIEFDVRSIVIKAL